MRVAKASRVAARHAPAKSVRERCTTYARATFSIKTGPRCSGASDEAAHPSRRGSDAEEHGSSGAADSAQAGRLTNCLALAQSLRVIPSAPHTPVASRAQAASSGARRLRDCRAEPRLRRANGTTALERGVHMVGQGLGVSLRAIEAADLRHVALIESEVPYREVFGEPRLPRRLG